MASGFVTSRTGPFPVSATGARPCRCGAAKPAKCCASAQSPNFRPRSRKPTRPVSRTRPAPTTWTCTGRWWTPTPSSARPGCRCSASPSSWTAGLTRAARPLRSGTTPSTVASASRPVSLWTTSAKVWIRPAAGSTRCLLCPRPCSIHPPTSAVCRLASSSTPRARRCPSRVATSSTPGTTSTAKEPTPRAGTW